MNVLIIGSGGREHALAWKAAQSPLVDKLYVAPGNAGTALENNLVNVAIPSHDTQALLEFAKDNAIGLTIVGPELPLVNGLVDVFRQANLPCYGPSQSAAQLEGSKVFAKEFMKRHQIPTASYQCFSDLTQALDYIHQCRLPIVIKANGLAAGKGVILAKSKQEAEQTLRDMLSGDIFGDAGHQVVIEEYLDGEEASFIVMTDGKTILPMATSQDHKAVGDGDTGPNTGGMGAVSPAPVVTDTVYQRILNEVIEPTINGMAAEGHPYLGFLYAGLMIMPDGTPKVIEFNCRFGDPETQPVLLRMQSDLVAHVHAAITGTLDDQNTQWDSHAAVGVVMAAGGYPGSYSKGDQIQGLPAEQTQGKVFHAGTALENDHLVTAGGRVLCVTALGESLSKAQEKAYAIVRKIHWKDHFYRKDIGYRAIAHEKNNEMN